MKFVPRSSPRHGVDPLRAVLATWTAVLAPTVALAQEATPPQEPTQAERLAELERENAELARRMDLLAAEIERWSLADLIPPLLPGEPGLGPAAAKVYGLEQGLAIGGYGEMLYQNHQPSSAEPDEIDLLRAVLYVGYRFDEHWLLNTEIEYEHGGEEVGVEFSYLDYLHQPELNARAGLLLVPMGFLNELHEPTTFLSALRPGIERVILPTTWREVGAGLHGELGDFVYRVYGLGGLDALGFSADQGLRGGRQNGSEALAEDFALTGRLDWMGIGGLTLGTSAWTGDSGQDQLPGGDVGTTILEGHAEWRWRGWQARALLARADLDDIAELNAALGFTGADSVGEVMAGGYVELGYDLLSWLAPESGQSLVPFARWETYDTQAEVPAGFSSDPANDVEILTVGLDWRPIDSIVLKLDCMDVSNGDDTAVDQWNVSLGYIF